MFTNASCTLFRMGVDKKARLPTWDAININSEFSPIQNTAELSGSDWIQLVINGGNGELYYRRYGKMVEIKGSVSPLNSGQWSLYTLPAGYRPSTASVDVLVMGNSPRNLNISTQGNVTLSDVTAHELIKLHACFLIN